MIHAIAQAHVAWTTLHGAAGTAQIVVPMQVALMPTASVVAYLVVTAAPRVETVATPPQLKSPLSLLCTLLI
jgi:hypothetical protein